MGVGRRTAMGVGRMHIAQPRSIFTGAVHTVDPIGLVGPTVNLATVRQ
jgi:hypothetical protein